MSDAETRGRIWKCWMFICLCGYRDVYGGHQAVQPHPKFRQTTAQRWARNEGWSRSKGSWICPDCTREKKKKR